MYYLLIIVLLVLAGVTYFMGHAVMGDAKSAMHQIFAAAYYIMSSVFLTGSFIIAAIAVKGNPKFIGTSSNEETKLT